MVAIEHAMRLGAIQTIRREAHALAGAARTIGFPKLGQSAATLQRACEGSGPGAGEIETMADLLRQSLLLASAWADAHEPVDASGA
jgi:HPt (histidine-containing phosphotransfer) domain-containing protein